jgi:hypothetical protein
VATLPQSSPITAKIANMKQGERTDLEPSANLPKVAQDAAAQRLNVSSRSVRSATKVRDGGVIIVVAFTHPRSPFFGCRADSYLAARSGRIFIVVISPGW